MGRAGEAGKGDFSCLFHTILRKLPVNENSMPFQAVGKCTVSYFTDGDTKAGREAGICPAEHGESIQR